jgi:hypothetical protein
MRFALSTELIEAILIEAWPHFMDTVTSTSFMA